MPEPNSSLLLYTFPSIYHPLIDSDNLEFFEHYHNIVTDAHSDDDIRKNHIKELKKMMILKKTAYPKAAMFWITLLFVIYLIVYFDTNANVIWGAIVYGILIVACVFWNFFAKSSGNINWNEFINIAEGNKSMKEKLAYFEKERDSANNLKIAQESRSNRSSVGSNLFSAGVGFMLGRSRV